MNSIKIEKGAIEELKRTIRLHDKMNEFLNDNDKEPSWDGDIYLYTSSDLKSEHIMYRIPTQVKGKNDESLMHRSSIPYSVKYKDLRNYRNDGGVCYFVIVVSDDGEKAAIFYNALTPIKLESLLKRSEQKDAEQKKNIVLMRLKNNDKNELYRILAQFGHDSKEQGVGELVRKAISIDDIDKIDSIRTTSFWANEQETMKSVSIGENCLYGHLRDADIWVPFSYDTQTTMILVTNRLVEASFSVDDVIFYNRFIVQVDKNDNMVICLSENLSINMVSNNINFTPKTDLEGICKDIAFLKAMECGKGLYVGKDKLAGYNYLRIKGELKNIINFYIKLKHIVDEFYVPLSKRFDSFDDNDWEAIDKLISLYDGKIKPKKASGWYLWCWEGKIIPFFLGTTVTGELGIENALHMKRFAIYCQDKNGVHYQVPSFITFKRDVWEKLYDVNENLLLEELERGTINEDIEGDYSIVFVELLATYDTTGNEKYYDLAKLISDKLIFSSPDNDYWKVNQLQILKRKRELSEEELQELEQMDQRTEDVKLICAINILLDNKRKAKKVLGDMPKEDKEEFINYPIYNLL